MVKITEWIRNRRRTPELRAFYQAALGNPADAFVRGMKQIMQERGKR